MAAYKRVFLSARGRWGLLPWWIVLCTWRLCSPDNDTYSIYSFIEWSSFRAKTIWIVRGQINSRMVSEIHRENSDQTKSLLREILLSNISRAWRVSYWTSRISAKSGGYRELPSWVRTFEPHYPFFPHALSSALTFLSFTLSVRTAI
jgi:hypothetical protein